MSWPKKGHRKAVREFNESLRGKPLIEVFKEEDQKRRLSDEELKSHLSPYWKKAADAGKNQLPNSITDRPDL